MGSDTIRSSYVRIWRTVCRIPRGKVASYGTVARVSGFPRQPRIAGYALHSLPPGTDIPWQRVINARGMISLPGSRGEEQQRLLEKEGVVFRRGKVDMTKYGWDIKRGKKNRGSKIEDRG